MTYAEIIEDYIQNYRERSRRELRSFAIIKSLAETIERAGMAITPAGKRFYHQRRISKDKLNQATFALSRAEPRIAACKTFEELFSVIKASVNRIKGIGELYIYDTSLRLGAKIGLSPNKVYLHAGTRVGAKALGLNSDAESLHVTSFSLEFRELEPREIEDVLCIYKSELRQMIGS